MAASKGCTIGPMISRKYREQLCCWTEPQLMKIHGDAKRLWQRRYDVKLPKNSHVFCLSSFHFQFLHPQVPSTFYFLRPQISLSLVLLAVMVTALIRDLFAFIRQMYVVYSVPPF
jgi:hypothetical protein